MPTLPPKPEKNRKPSLTFLSLFLNALDLASAFCCLFLGLSGSDSVLSTFTSVALLSMQIFSCLSCCSRISVALLGDRTLTYCVGRY